MKNGKGVYANGDGENVINSKQLRVPREQLLLSRTEHKKHIPERQELPVNPQYFIAFSSLKMSFGPNADEANMSHQRYGPKTNHYSSLTILSILLVATNMTSRRPMLNPPGLRTQDRWSQSRISELDLVHVLSDQWSDGVCSDNYQDLHPAEIDTSTPDSGHITHGSLDVEVSSTDEIRGIDPILELK